MAKVVILERSVKIPRPFCIIDDGDYKNFVTHGYFQTLLIKSVENHSENL
jgi:hypothetical protein